MAYSRKYDKNPCRAFRPEERPSNVKRLLITGTSSKGKLPGCYRDKEFTLTPDYVSLPYAEDAELAGRGGGFSVYKSALKNGRPITLVCHHPEGAWYVQRYGAYRVNWVTVQILEEELPQC